jgi:DNA replication licensing factor MCM3
MDPLRDAVDETTRNLDSKYIQEGEEIYVGFEGQFGFHRVSPRELLSPFLGTLVSVEGIITKCELLLSPIKSTL